MQFFIFCDCRMLDLQLLGQIIRQQEEVNLVRRVKRRRGPQQLAWNNEPPFSGDKSVGLAGSFYVRAQPVVKNTAYENCRRTTEHVRSPAVLVLFVTTLLRTLVNVTLPFFTSMSPHSTVLCHTGSIFSKSPLVAHSSCWMFQCYDLLLEEAKIST